MKKPEKNWTPTISDADCPIELIPHKQVVSEEEDFAVKICSNPLIFYYALLF